MLRVAKFLLAVAVGSSLGFSAKIPKRGSADGAGVDYPTAMENIAWFSGRQKIRYCVETSPDFGVSAEVAEKAFLTAAQAWNAFLEKNNISNILNDGNRMNLRFEKIPSCTGYYDLALLFGTQSDKVTAAKKKYLHPVSFTEREEYDSVAAWSKGFVWVQNSKAPLDKYTAGPNWSYGHHLVNLLRHELGHILGCSHMDGTIMAADFIRLLYTEPMSGMDNPFILEPNKFSLGVQPLFKFVNSYHYVIQSRATYQSEALSQGFEILFGRKPKGKVTGEVIATGYVDTKDAYEIAFHIKDESSTEVLNLSIPEQDWLVFRVGAPLLQRAEFGGGARDGGMFYTAEKTYGFGAQTEVKTKSGEIVKLALKINADDSQPLRLDYYSKGKRVFFLDADIVE